MKKVLMFLVVSLFLFSLSGQAFAAFALGDLIRVVYQDNGNVEYATDLGAFSATTPIPSNMPFAGQDTFSTGTFGTTFDHLYVGYFVVTTTNQAWTSGPLTGQQAGNRKGNAFFSAGSSVVNYYHAMGSGTSYQGDKGNLSSYFTKMDNATLNNGIMGTLIPAANAEASLAALATTGYVDQMLYYYTGTASGAPKGSAVAYIRTFADGHTELHGVPIPAAVYLFGSGLLGLVGIRRRMSA
jgi:hypothetical protein